MAQELVRFGHAVRELREQRDMSTSDLAAATGFTRRRIDRIEIGEAQIRFDVIVALAKGLGVGYGAFFLQRHER